MTDAPPPLIFWVPDVSARTQFILPNIDYINTLPFDGFVINIPASWSLMSPGYVVQVADLRDWLLPLQGFNQDKLNYLQANTDDPGDLFDDAAWAQVTENWRLLAQVAREAGFAGILYDNEEYAGRWHDFPEDYPASAAAIGLTAYQAKAQARAADIMAAVNSAFPTAAVAVAHGPYLSVPEAAESQPAIEAQAGGAYQHELVGPFFTGLLQGAGPGQTLIDAGELYQLRTDAEFAQSFAYRNETLPGLIKWPVALTDLESWPHRVSVGHIVYTGEFPQGYEHSVQTITATLRNAMAHSEGAVFLYSEVNLLDWLTPGGVPKDWIEAVRAARRP